MAFDVCLIVRAKITSIARHHYDCPALLWQVCQVLDDRGVATVTVESALILVSDDVLGSDVVPHGPRAHLSADLVSRSALQAG